MKHPVASLLFLSVSLLAGCSGNGERVQATATPPAASDVVRNALTAVQSAESFHFKLRHENGTSPLPLGLELESAEGDVVVPDRLSAEVRAKAGGFTVSVNAIGIGDRAWITNPFTRRWQPLPGASMRDIADPAALTSAVLTSLKEPQLSGSDEVDGVRTYRLAGLLDAAALQHVLGSAQVGYVVAVEIDIGHEDWLPRRVRLAGRLSPAEPENIVRQLDLSRFGRPVDIRPPE